MSVCSRCSGLAADTVEEGLNGFIGHNAGSTMRALNRVGKSARAGRRVYPGLCLVLAFGTAVPLSGCTRHFYRKLADKEVDSIVAEKDCNPAWRVEQWHVYPDPRARFADPTNPDRPPMPPDDFAAWEQSPHSQRPGRQGVARIIGNGYLDLLANWDGENRAKLEQAAEKTLSNGGTSVDALKMPTTAPKADDGGSEAAKAVATGPTRPFLLNLNQA